MPVAPATSASTASDSSSASPPSASVSQGLLTLFDNVKQQYPSTLDPEGWYLVTLACLTASPEPGLAANLYSQLVGRLEDGEGKKRLMRRMRECLVKCVILIGVVKPLEAAFAIERCAADEDRDFSFSREGWTNNEEFRDRGTAWLGRLYRGNIEGINDRFQSMRDFGWISREITYGLFLSDHSILDEVETELVVLSAIMMQNQPTETGWHLRGMRRIGMSQEAIEGVQRCIELVASYMDVKVDRVPRVQDIEHEV